MVRGMFSNMPLSESNSRHFYCGVRKRRKYYHHFIKRDLDHYFDNVTANYPQRSRYNDDVDSCSDVKWKQ